MDTTLAAAAAYFAFRSLTGRPPALVPVPLTSYPGSETQPSFSPDGNQVAFTWNGETEADWNVYVKLVSGSTQLKLTATPATEHSPAWSPDGTRIAFFRQSEAGSGFYLISPLGGQEEKICDAETERTGLDSPYVAWSPEGSLLALADRNHASQPAAIYLYSFADRKRTRLTSPPAQSFGDSAPAFSADGKSLAFIRTFKLAVQDLFVVSLQGAEERRLTSNMRRIYGMAWNSGDGSIVYSSSREGGSRLWRIASPGAKPERLTAVGENATFIAFSRDGKRLAYTRSMLDTNVWLYDLNPNPTVRRPPQRSVSSTRLEQGPKFSPDGERIAYASNQSGTAEIWVSDRNGENNLQLTSFGGPATGSPFWSPDAKQIAFDSRPDGNPDIFVVQLEGHVLKRMTQEPSQDLVPSWSRDGTWLYFASDRSGRFEIWRMPSQGGPAQQVTRQGGFHGVESPDGKYLYYTRSHSEPGLWRVPLAGGDETPVLPSLRGTFWGYWGVTERGIYYLDRQDAEAHGIRYFLRLFDPASKGDREVMEMPRRPYNSGLSISPDGRSCLYTQVDRSDTDIMLVDYR